MSIISKEDLLNKQKEVQNTISTYTCRVLVCPVPAAWLPEHRKYMMKCQSSSSDLDRSAGGDAERYSPSWRGKNRMPGSL